MKSEFEKLPQIESHLHNVVFDEGSNEYLAKKMGHLPFEFSEWFLNGSWTIYQHQQSKVDELQKKNAWLSDVAERENKRANKLQEEKVSTTTLLGKTIQEKNELQKRVDKALKMLDQFYCEGNLDSLEKAEQALKGEHA